MIPSCNEDDALLQACKSYVLREAEVNQLEQRFVRLILNASKITPPQLRSMQMAISKCSAAIICTSIATELISAMMVL